MQAQVDLNDKSRNQMLDCRSKVIPNLDSLLKLLILTNIEDFFEIQENYQNTAEITTICKTYVKSFTKVNLRMVQKQLTTFFND